jgi:hypothetical protein
MRFTLPSSHARWPVTLLQECKVLVDDENGIPMTTAMRNHFRCLDVLNLMDRGRVQASKWVTGSACGLPQFPQSPPRSRAR